MQTVSWHTPLGDLLAWSYHEISFVVSAQLCYVAYGWEEGGGLGITKKSPLCKYGGTRAQGEHFELVFCKP